MTVDSTLAFAARRNIPTRYNRDLLAKTLKGMEYVAEVRARRERVFYRQRMQGNRQRQMEADRKLVAENQHLLPMWERDEIPEFMREELEREKMENEQEAVEAMDVEEEWQGLEDEEEQEQDISATVKSRMPKVKQTRKLKMKVGGGMDIDED
jgi:large subunit ribosomal protein L24e